MCKYENNVNESVCRDTNFYGTFDSAKRFITHRTEEKYLDESISAEERAKDLLSVMSIEEKMAQIVGFNPAYWSRDNLDRDYPVGAGQVSMLSGIEKKTITEVIEQVNQLQRKIMDKSEHHIPALFHVETLCGVMLPYATAFPSGIAQAATFDPIQQKKMGEIIGRQARAAGASQAFAPVLDISRDSRFGRQGETYGEDPTLAAAMGVACIKGLQKDGNLKEGVMAVAKHFLGYQNAQGGIHAAACDIPERLLREVYAKPFQAAITEGGLVSVMPCYSSINGEPVSGSKTILTKLLREEMGFDGLVVSDYCAVSEIHERQKVCENLMESGFRALSAGIDQELPSKKSYGDELAEYFRTGKADMKVLDTAVYNVLRAKFRLGLFERPYCGDLKQIKECYENPENEKVTLTSAQKSLVLVKNDGCLPLKKGIKKITVIGYHGASVRAMFGGYSYMSMTESALGAGNTMAGLDMKSDSGSVQAGNGTYPGTLVQREHLEADKQAREILPQCTDLLEELRINLVNTVITYSYGYPYAGNDCSYHEEAIRSAEDAEVIIMTVGGKYGTGTTASIGEGVDATDINLPECQEKLIEKIAVLKKPIIIIHFGGRPVSSDNADLYADAILEAWNPGEKGAEAIVSVLTGAYNPAGRMPVTTAYNAGQIPIYYNHQHGSSYHQDTISAYKGYVDCPHEPRYCFGHGLSYTVFSYENLKMKSNNIDPEESLSVSVDIRNIGNLDGEEVIQLYIRDCYASMNRPVLELVGFYRVSLTQGEKKTIRFTMKLSQFAFLDKDMKWKIEAGCMELMVGASSQDIRLRDSFSISRDLYVDGKNRGFYAEVTESDDIP